MPPNVQKVMKLLASRRNSVKPAGGVDNPVSTRLKTPEEMQGTYKQMMSDRPTNSLLDIPVNLGKKVLSDPNQSKFDDTVFKYQTKLMDLDRSVGENLAGKNKIFKKVFTITDHKPLVRVESEEGKIFDAFIPTENARFTAVNDKTKGLAVPMLALFGLSSIIDKEDKLSKEVGRGETDLERVSSSDSEKARELLIDKIANTLASIGDTVSPQPVVDKKEALVGKIQKASELLKKASHTITDLEERVGEVTTENQKLKLQILAKTRSSMATKLAQDMLSKEMIKKAEFNSKVDYIMGLNDENYSVLKNTVSSVPFPKKANHSNTGVDKLSYMALESDNSNPEKPSFEDAIINLGKS